MISQPSRAGVRSRWGPLLLAAGVGPIVFAVGAIIGIIQANEIAPDSVLAETSTLWMVTVLVGAFLVVPALVGLIVGVVLSRWASVASAVVVLTSLAIMTGVYVLVMAGGVLYGLGDPTPPSQVLTDGDVLPRLSLAGVAVFVTPFVLMVSVNALAIRATWARSAVTNEATHSSHYRTERTVLRDPSTVQSDFAQEHLPRSPLQEERGR